MCGIAAITHSGNEESTLTLKRMLNHLKHRGQTDLQNETGASGNLLMGCNRLAINSQPQERQPAISADGQVGLVLNGEIYNCRELATKYLKQSNDRTNDSSILADLLSKFGFPIVAELDGMFAIIWADGQRVFAARDRIGIKPLYYAELGSSVLLASEIKALSNEKEVSEIKCVMPGDILEITNGTALSVSTSVSQCHCDDAQSGCDTDFEGLLMKAIEHSVSLRLQENEATGIYLSGGVDSSGLFAIASQLTDNVVPLVLGRPGSADRQAADRLLRGMGKNAVSRDCETEATQFEDICETVRIAESFEPNVIRATSLQRQLSLLAEQAGITVILCGEGADELFCGYPEFAVENADWRQLRMQFLRDLHRTQLQRVDRGSMSLTKEVRVPFLSADIVDLATGCRCKRCFLTGTKEAYKNKICLRKALSRVLPSWCAKRPKITILEGCGMRGNDPADGMFSDLAADKISDARFREIQNSFPEWAISTPEEAYYFEIFHSFGYSKASFMKDRVTACGKNCNY